MIDRELPTGADVVSAILRLAAELSALADSIAGPVTEAAVHKPPKVRSLEPTPAVLGDADLRRLLPISARTFYRLKAAGTFDGLRNVAQLTKRTTYSGVLVRRWLDGGGQWLARRGARTGP